MRVYLRADLKEKRIPWSNTYLLKLEGEGKFPRRFYIGARTPGWDGDAVDRCIEQRARDNKPPVMPHPRGRPEAA